MVVINAFIPEALCINQVNDWLTYALPVHRIREFGHVSPYLDLASERVLTLFEMRDYCIFLFGYDMMIGVTDPTTMGWSRFIVFSKRSVRDQEEQWDPCHNKRRPILDIKRLSQIYGPSKQRKVIFRCFARCV